MIMSPLLGCEVCPSTSLIKSESGISKPLPNSPNFLKTEFFKNRNFTLKHGPCQFRKTAPELLQRIWNGINNFGVPIPTWNELGFGAVGMFDSELKTVPVSVTTVPAGLS